MKGKWIQLTIRHLTHPNAVVPIGDVGSWNGGDWHEYDDPYWRNNHRPQSETGKDLKHRKTNKLEFSYRTNFGNYWD